MTEITPDLLLRAYAAGVFPMAESSDADDLFWVDPEMRGIIPLDEFHIPKRLARTVRAAPYAVTFDRDFKGVIDACASEQSGRGKTWINAPIKQLYTSLFEAGFAHSVECWQDEKLVGGLYGVALGGAFFGESMFHTARDASKIALVHLVARMKAGSYRLLDTQFVTDHLEQFGAIEVTRAEYQTLLAKAVPIEAADFYSLDPLASPSAILQSITQTS